VGVERVRAVAAARDRELVAGRDEHDAAVEVPRRRGRRAPALEDRGVH
jgi:hypothetical protein